MPQLLNLRNNQCFAAAIVAHFRALQYARGLVAYFLATVALQVLAMVTARRNQASIRHAAIGRDVVYDHRRDGISVLPLVGRDKLAGCRVLNISRPHISARL